MDVLAPLIRCLIAPAWALWERSPYLRQYNLMLKTQYSPIEIIRQRQWETIDRLLTHAYETTSFYRHRFKQQNLATGDIRGFEDFRRIPLLSKADLRTHQRDMVSAKYDPASLKSSKTSGSTGVPVEILAVESKDQFGRACTLRADEWSGWRLGERVALLWGNPEYLRHGWRGKLRNAFLERATYLDTLKMEEDDMRRFAAALCRRPPSLLFGHAHSLYLLANFFKDRGGPSFRPNGIISTAMVLHEWERRTIENVFKCPVTNRYGCEEVGLIACQCEQHNGFHINADGVYVEIVRIDGTPSPPGEPGLVVVTDLTNFAMPIIRYQIGDMAVSSNRTCKCGRTLPLLENVEGRVADYVVTPSGRMISGISLTDHFNTLVPGVAQMQILQEKVDRFVFRIVKTPDFGPASHRIISRLVSELFGEGVHHQCEFVKHILQEPSGKYRFVISTVQKETSVTPSGYNY